MAGNIPSVGSSQGPAEDWDAPIVAELNITPLTDIFLVLLIIFMVTSSVMSQVGVDVELPSASSAMSQAQPEGVIVTLLKDGALKINDVRVASGDWNSFQAHLKQFFKVTPSRLVILEGDRRAFLGNVVELMDQARLAGAEDFAIAAQVGP